MEKWNRIEYPKQKWTHRLIGTGNAWAGHKNVMDVFCLPDNTIILFPDIIRGATLPTGSKLL